MRTYKIFFIGVLVAMGLSGLFGCKNNKTPEDALQDKQVVEQALNKKTQSDLLVKKITNNEYRVMLRDIPPEFHLNEIYSNPEIKAGRSTEISVSAMDKGANSGELEIILYEDEKAIDSIKEKGTYVYAKFNIIKTSPEKHTYFAEAIDKGGNKTRSKEISVEFSGKTLDLPPELLFDIVLEDDGGIYVAFTDYGDNKGLKGIALYQDNKVIHSFEELIPKNRLELNISLASLVSKEGKHTYFVEAIDKGGNKTRSQTISVEFVK